MTWKKTREAFTLVELLVVIAIIALLVAILMPALNKARLQGQAIVCSSRLHQLAIACQMYAMKYNNTYFPSYEGDQAWATSSQAYELETLSGSPPKNGAIFYPGCIFDCPTQQPRGAAQGKYWAAAVATVPFEGYLDYAYNACLGDGDINSPIYPPPKATMKHESSTVMFWDSTRYRGYYCPTIRGSANPDYWNDTNTRVFGQYFHPLPAFMQWPHSKTANFVFVDGHTERAAEKTVKDDWFNPGF